MIFCKAGFVTDDEIDRARSKQVSRRMHVGFWWETRRKQTNRKT
jgi:hypothetical protein